MLEADLSSQLPQDSPVAGFSVGVSCKPHYVMHWRIGMPPCHAGAAGGGPFVAGAAGQLPGALPDGGARRT